MTLERHGNIEVAFNRRRYPGTTYVWAYWRFVGEHDDQWESAGDPACGLSATAVMREAALSLARAAMNPEQ